MREREWERARKCTSMSECTYTGIKVGLERWLAALTYDPGSVPSTHMAAYKNFNPSFREPDALFWPLQSIACTWHTNADKTHIKLKEKNLVMWMPESRRRSSWLCNKNLYCSAIWARILILICNLKIHIFLISVYACLSHVCEYLCRPRRTSDPLELEL